MVDKKVVIGRVNGEVVFQCNSCKGPRLSGNVCVQCENTTLRSKLRVLKSQLKNASGLIDQAIQEIDETLGTDVARKGSGE